MSTHGWNSNYANVSHFGREHARPYSSTPTMFACRICDKICLSTLALLKHYESHEDDFAQQRQIHQRTNNISCHREGRDINFNNNHFQNRLSPSSVFQQRYHPYFPNGYRTLQQQARERNPAANTNPSFPISSQNSTLSQPRNHPVANNNTLAVSSAYPISIQGQTSVASTSQSPVNQPTHPQQLSDQKPAPPQPIANQKGFDESKLRSLGVCSPTTLSQGLRRINSTENEIMYVKRPLCSISVDMEGIRHHVSSHMLEAAVGFQSPHPMVPTQQLRERNLLFNPFNQSLPSPAQPTRRTSGSNSLQMQRSAQGSICGRQK